MFTNNLIDTPHWVIAMATCLQNFRPATLTVFEILGFKLKNKNDKKKLEKYTFSHISHICSPILTIF